MPWPQMIIICLMSFGVGMNYFGHGTPRTGKYDGWTSLIAAVINVGILYWCGFWDVFWSK